MPSESDTLRQKVAELEHTVDQLQAEKKLADEAFTKALEGKTGEISRLYRIVLEQSRNLQEATASLADAQEELAAITAPPLLSNTVLRANDDQTAEVSTRDGRMLVGVSPGIKPGDMPRGTRVWVSTKTGSVVRLVPAEEETGDERTLAGILDGRTALVSAPGGERSTVLISDALVPESLTEGSRVVVNGGMIVRVIPRGAVGSALGSASELALAEMPDISFADIAGHDAIIRDVVNAIMDPYDFPERYRQYKKPAECRFLLYGPPGNGKTSIAKAVARMLFERFKDKILPHAKGNFIAIRGPELSSKWVGETERVLRETFDGAQHLYDVSGAPVIIFIDDCESFLLQRGTSNASTVTMDYVNQFNTLLDGVKELRGVSVFLSTNRIDLLDVATVDRMHRKVQIKAPTTRPMAEAVLRVHLRDVPLAQGPDPVAAAVDRIFEASSRNEMVEVHFEDRYSDSEIFELHEFLSGRLLAAVVARAKEFAIARDKQLAPDAPPSGITAADLAAALDEEFVNSDSLPTTRRTVEEWLRQRGDKRKPVLVNALRDPKSSAAQDKHVRRLDRLVQ